MTPSTLRDYFAAHAPIEPQWDFPVRGYEQRPKLVLSPNTKYCVNTEEINAFDRGRIGAKRQQWPFVWADQMVLERGFSHKTGW